MVDRLATEMRVGHADPWWSGEIGCSGPSLLTLTMSVRRLDDDGAGVDGWNDVDDDAGHGYPRAPYDLRPVRASAWRPSGNASGNAFIDDMLGSVHRVQGSWGYRMHGIGSTTAPHHAHVHSDPRRISFSSFLCTQFSVKPTASGLSAPAANADDAAAAAPQHSPKAKLFANSSNSSFVFPLKCSAHSIANSSDIRHSLTIRETKRPPFHVVGYRLLMVGTFSDSHFERGSKIGPR